MTLASYEVLDPRFSRLVRASEHLEILHQGCRWAEGPAYFPAARSLVWSDIPNDRMFRFDETDGSVSVFRQPAGYSNGNTVDRQGRLITCEHGGRRLSRTDFDGSITNLASHHKDGRLNSPNDVVVKSDGSIWFTDPVYGIESDYEGHRGEREQDGSYVYRISPNGELAIALDDFVQPNGIAFSPDESILYVVDTGRSHKPDGPAHIRQFTFSPSGALIDHGVFADCTVGSFDGLRLDCLGHLWTSAGDGVHCYHPDGTLLGKILIPEEVANVCFGGPKFNYLYICATTSLYGLKLLVNGARTF